MANTIEITIKQTGSGSAISTTIKELDRLGGAASSSGGLLGGFGKSLGSVFSVAGGIIAADVFRNIARSITGLVSTALSEFASYERMALSVQSLVARELSQGQQVEVQRQVLAGLTKKEADELAGLAGKIQDEELARNTLRARIQEQSESLRQLRDAHGDDALNVQTATARLEQLTDQYNDAGTEIDNMKNRLTELSGKEGQLVTVMDKVRVGQMDMNTAMEQAGPRAAELLSWISKVAVMSPFSEKGIQDAFSTALAYGFTTEAAQRLTQAEVDFAAATGKGVEATGLIALALGQMQAKGKVSGQEIIQLTNAGIGVNKILEDMGFTLDDVSNGLVDSDKFIEAVIKDMEIFEGAAADQANTFSGLISTLGDLKAIGLREFFTGTFTAIQPYLADFVGMLTSAALETGSIRALGDVIGQYVGAALQKAAGLASAFYESIQKVVGAFQRFGVRGATVSILGQLGLDPTQIAGVMGVVDQITGAIDKITGAFERFGLKGATVSLMGMLGLDPETIGTIFTAIDNISNKISTLQAIFSQFGAQGAGISLLSMLGLSSETIGLITTSIQSVVDGFNSLANWWTTTWPIVQAAALTGWEVLKGIFAGFQAALGPVLTQLNTQFTQVFTQIGTLLSSFGISWSDVWTALLTATGIVAAGIGAAIVGIIGVVAGLATGIAEGISAAITMFQNLSLNVAGIFMGLTVIFVGWVETFKALMAGDFAGAWEGFKIVLDGAVTFWTNMWGGMITVAVGTLDIISSSISGFVTGIVGFFQGLYNQLVGNSIIPDLINDITSWFKKLPQMILSALSNFASQVVTPFEDAWDSIQEVWKPEKWMQLGVSAIEGLLEGLKSKAGDVLEFLKTLAKDSLTGLGQFWGAQSPATEFMPLGASAIQGLLLGAQKENFAKRFIDDLDMGGIARSLGTGGGQWRNFRNLIKQHVGANFETLMTSGMSAAEVIGKIQQVAARFNFPPSFASEFAMANGLIEHLTSSVSEFQQAMRIENIGNMLQMTGQISGIAGNFASLLQPALDARGSIIQRLQDFIESGSSELFRFDFAPHLVGVDHVMMNQIRAQEQLNLLLREQEEQEALITAQKEAQQKLTFLQAQLDLIKLGRELGGNIFEGMTFGLNASVEDLLAATNAVTEAMISQINADLQIASPSRVLFKMFRDQVGGAMAGGLMAARPMLQGIISPVLNPIMEGAAQAGRVVNNYFNQTVHTNAEQSTVIGDFRTMQLMAGS